MRAIRVARLTLLLALVVCPAIGQTAETRAVADGILKSCGVTGGLCVQVGCGDGTLATELARTGRFLVHVLDASPSAVEQARQRLHSQGLYGLASVERLESAARLPYTENLVNLLVIGGRPQDRVPPAEVTRVVCPGGVVLVAAGSEPVLAAAGLRDVRRIQAGGAWTMGRKPWPDEMDCWTHPRHAADGNAVSRDTLVAPPRRVRWVAGAPREENTMVTSAGRNFYGHALARDGFNGLRLWQRGLKPRGRYVVPIAGGELLFAVSDTKVLALDGATGRTVREYPEAGTPRALIHESGVLIGVCGGSVRALEAETGRLRWRYDAAAPRCVVAGDNIVALLRGRPERGEKCALVVLDMRTGKVRWERDDFPWAAKVRRCVYHQGQLACEISTYNDDGPGNAIHVVSAADGKPLWSHAFSPGMNHAKQARAMFVGDRLWILHGGKHGSASKCSALDRRTGQVQVTHEAGLCHCFPPVATPRYLFSGEMDLVDLATGRVDANRITKAACGRDRGWIPANGLIYVTPKHCVCWPMLRGYAALAPARPEGSVADGKIEQADFVVEKGVAPPPPQAVDAGVDPWPCYRHDAWRSGSTPARVPAELEVRWTAALGGRPDGLVADDWRENPFVRAPVTPPVVAGGLVYVARPDAHQLVALDARAGGVRWRFTANGRIDTAPTIHRGLCLFGCKSGWVYCLRADDGRLVWRLRAAPIDERIVAYGQLEAPWPVPGSVLVVDDVAFFAAGRQPLADGGILVFAVEPSSGGIRWVKRLKTVPQKGFYRSSALEFDNFDLLHREGDCVAMSRWLFDRATGKMAVKAKDAFALLKTGGSGAMVPRGCWTYAPRHRSRTGKHWSPLRPLVAFRDNTLLGCSQDKRSVYRRDFRAGEKLDPTWITGWALSDRVRKREGERWRSQRLAQGAKWSVEVFPQTAPGNAVAAMVLTRDTLFVAGSRSRLIALAAADGKLLAERDLPAPVWDGMAAAAGRLFVSTSHGQVVCLGERASAVR